MIIMKGGIWLREGKTLEKRLERIKKLLHSKSYKLTPQREATVRVLLEHEDDHLSAEDVFLLVKEIGRAHV